MTRLGSKTRPGLSALDSELHTPQPPRVPRFSSVLAALWLWLLACTVITMRSRTYALLIRGGRVLDGSGTPWLQADVAITGDRIVAVGKLDHATAKREVD